MCIRSMDFLQTICLKNMKNASHLIIQTLRILMLLRIHDAWKLPETRNAGGNTKLIYRFFSSAIFLAC